MTNPRATSESVLALFTTEGHKFSARNLATAAHRAVKLRRQDLRRDRRMMAPDAARSRLAEFDSRAPATTAWTFATARVEAPDPFTGPDAKPQRRWRSASGDAQRRVATRVATPDTEWRLEAEAY